MTKLVRLAAAHKAAPPSVTYATWEASTKGASISLSNGDLTATLSGAGVVRATIGKSSGKWYWEYHVDSVSGLMLLGFGDDSLGGNNYGGYLGDTSFAWEGWRSDTGANYQGGTNRSFFAGGGTYAVGDTIGVVLDATARDAVIYKNNVLVGTMHTLSLTSAIRPCVTPNGGVTANFGATAFVYPTRPVTDGANAGMYT